jgi:amino acid adenylation domain-containing protein
VGGDLNSDKVEAVYQLSPAQQGILFHTLYARDSQVYFLQVSCALEEELDEGAFEQAWRQLVERHPVFRTAFVWEEVAEPLQVVGRRAALPFERQDWRGLNEEEQRARLEEFLRADRERGLDLAHAPLMRLSLIRLADRRYQFTWSLHHILLDGWSQSLVLKEIFTLYEANRRGQRLALARPRPYRDYIAWLRGQDVGRAESFWRRTLAGFSEPTPLPLGHQPGERAAAAGDGYGQRRALLSEQETAALEQCARRAQVTLNTLVQGAWALLLSRLTGERDVVFGAVVSGRPPALAGVEEMVGLFINTLPVRVEVNEEGDLGGWLRRLQQAQAEMRQYEYSPLVEVQGWSDVPRGLPLFESILDFQNYSLSRSAPRQGRELIVDDFGFISRTNYPLEVVVQSGPVLDILITYDRQRIADEAAGRLLSYLRAMLVAVEAGPQARLSALSPVAEAERDQLLFGWNDTDAYYPSDRLAHELFEAQAARTPAAVAVSCGGRVLSYDALNRRANRMAHALAECGVGADSLVPLLAGRGADFLAAMLAVFKAGGAYIPLDPGHPPQRLGQVLAQSGARVVLAERRFGPALAQALEGAARGSAPRVFFLEDLAGREYAETNLAAPCVPRNLAYVIYTSGSTGRPKGAMVEHRGMLNHLFAKILELELTAADAVAQTASQAFDISVWQFLAPLLVGGRVHVVADEVVHDPARLLGEIEAGGVTIFETVPSLLRAALDDAAALAAAGRELQRLRWLILTGEALPPELCRGWLRLFPRTPLLNAYGPTECSDDVTHQRIHEPPAEGAARVPIGVPVINTRLYVLDRGLRPAPAGVAGELYVGGEGVGRGYLNEPARTAGVFVPDPFSREQGARLYRTGDLVRRLPGGELDFLGRLDQQVKLRGFRIELGEIEAALCEHEAVRECVVLAREDEPGDKRLVAYVVAEVGAAPGADELRAHLKDRLPDYMAPSAFVALDALPLNSNGKVDRRALPAPESGRSAAAPTFAPPRTPTETALAQMWAETLRVERVGLDDNFFDLGGHSLNATQLVSRVRARFGVDLQLADFFAAATVRGAAERIEAALVEQADAAKMDELLSLLEGLEEGEAEDMLGAADAAGRGRASHSTENER